MIEQNSASIQVRALYDTPTRAKTITRYDMNEFLTFHFARN